MPAPQLPQWLDYIRSLHNQSIDLGLERVKQVAERLNILHFECPVIMVSGTNGKGSTIATLDSIYQAAGYKTARFMSPKLLNYTDQIQIAGQDVSEADLVRAFEAINEHRQDVTLTEFEFLTLAALYLFQEQTLDLILLEIGMGGREDAVNIVDADIAIITTISLEHQTWLGDTIEAIAEQKAGIMRANKPVICGMRETPRAIREHAEKLQAPLYCLGQEFSIECANESWHWNLQDCCKYCHLPFPKLDIHDVALALMAVNLLEAKMNVSKPALYQGIQSAELPGRFQVIDDDVTTVFDVAHNPQSCENLLSKVKQNFPNKRIRAVVGMLKDKDIPKCFKPFQQYVVKWYVTGLDVDRGASCEKLQKVLKQLAIADMATFASVADALIHAKEDCAEDEIVLVFGSFITVARGLNASKEELV